MSYEPGISKIKEKKTGGVKDYARAILGQGLGLGFGDEAEAYVRSILNNEDYDEVIKEVRSEIQQFREEQPVAAYGSELAGGLLTGVAGLGRTALSQAIKQAPKTTAGVQSALYGVGTGEGDIRTAEGLIQRGAGGAIGGTLGVAGTAAGQAVLPRVTEQARKLLKEGVPLTPGQAMGGPESSIIGGALRIGEEALSSVPGTGVSKALRKGQEAFNVRGFEKAVQGIEGVKVDKSLPVNKLYQNVQKQLSDKYDDVVKVLKIPNIKNVRSDSLNIINSSNLSQSQRSGLINRYISPYQNRTNLKGSDVQKLLQKIKRDITAKSKSENVDILDEAEVLKQVRNVIEGNTVNIGKLKKVDTAYQQVQTLGEAATKSADELYTPAQLRAAVKQADKTRSKVQFKRGEAPLQEYAELGQEVLGRTLPESGTVPRSILGYGLLGGGAGVGAGTGTLTPAGVGIAGYLAALQNPVTNAILRESINLASLGTQKSIPYISGQGASFLTQQQLLDSLSKND
jgi:hypothetical protein